MPEEQNKTLEWVLTGFRLTRRDVRRAIRWKTHLALTWWPSVRVCSSVCSTIAYLNFFVLGKDFDGGSKEVRCGILIKCF